MTTPRDTIADAYDEDDGDTLPTAPPMPSEPPPSMRPGLWATLGTWWLFRRWRMGAERAIRAQR